MASGRARTERSTFEIPTVTTERLQLRAFQAGDLDAYAAMQANPEVMRFLVDGRSIPALKSGESWLVLWAIGRSAATGCGPAKKWTAATLWEASDILQPLDRPEPELAYSLDQPFWGQSFATEAATAARDWLFGHFRWLALRASFGPTITRRSALHDGSGRFVKPGADGFANLMGVTLPRST
jgi:RimJ/RimL family protein N-acetyltransferase